MQNKFLVIYGPTGVGKTDLSQVIARKVPAEIINMDVGQFYTPFTIGTAKPIDWQSDPLVHHMFDILDAPENLTVVNYRNTIATLIKQITGRNRLPILVGGSGFYLRSLLFPPISDNPLGEITFENNDELDESWDSLYAIDPQRALDIKPSDNYRISRAFQILKKTGIKPSLHTPLYNPLFDYKIICVTRNRQELYERINKRVEIMFELGWISEVKEIIGTDWENFILQKKLIGYNELVKFLREDGNEKDLYIIKEKIKQRSRHYAKRQLTFWRMLQKQIINEDQNKEKDLHELNLTELDSKKESEYLIEDIAKWFKKD